MSEPWKRRPTKRPVLDVDYDILQDYSDQDTRKILVIPLATVGKSDVQIIIQDHHFSIFDTQVQGQKWNHAVDFSFKVKNGQE